MRVRLGEGTTETLVGIVLDDVGLPRQGPVWLTLLDEEGVEVSRRRLARWRALGQWGPVELAIPDKPEEHQFRVWTWVCASACGTPLRVVEGPLLVGRGDTVHIRDFTVTVS